MNDPLPSGSSIGFFWRENRGPDSRFLARTALCHSSFEHRSGTGWPGICGHHAKLFQDILLAEARIRGDLAPFKSVTTLVPRFDHFQTPEKLDLVWMGKIYHDFPNTGEM